MRDRHSRVLSILAAVFGSLAQPAAILAAESQLSFVQYGGAPQSGQPAPQEDERKRSQEQQRHVQEQEQQRAQDQQQQSRKRPVRRKRQRQLRVLRQQRHR